jgi:cysteine desulfurase
MNIYLDHAATTKPDPEIFELFVATSLKYWGNPSATHLIGQKARASLEKSRIGCANLLGAKNQEIYFTGTATEANNLAIQGIILESQKRIPKPHILISPLEHSSVSDFKNYPNTEVQTFPINPNGICDIDQIIPLIRDETILICLMLVSNEIGTIQPVKKLALEIEKINVVREQTNLPKIYLHSDCVQAPLYQEINFHELGVDFAVISSHKLYAPRGAAILFIKNGTKIHKTIYGGGQEKSLRSGTEDVSAIACLHQALYVASSNLTSVSTKIRELRDYMASFIQNNLPTVIINGDLIHRTPNNLHITVPSIDEDSLIMTLGLNGFAVSAGSSCASGAHQKSGISNLLHPESVGADLRVTLGKNNTLEEVKLFCDSLQDIIGRLSNKKV